MVRVASSARRGETITTDLADMEILHLLKERGGWNDFANSIFEKLSRHLVPEAHNMRNPGRFSQEQWFWAVKLAEQQRVSQKEQAAVDQKYGDQPFPMILELMQNATRNLKYPKLLLRLMRNDKPYLVRLSLAGSKSAIAGSVKVQAHEEKTSRDKPVWFGAIIDRTKGNAQDHECQYCYPDPCVHPSIFHPGRAASRMCTTRSARWRGIRCGSSASTERSPLGAASATWS